MRHSQVLFALFLVGSTSFCQTAYESRTTTLSTFSKTFCPVEIKATWSKSSAKLLPADSSGGQQQNLEITLSNSQPLTARRAQVTVYGFPPGARSVPAVVYSLGANPLEVAKSFTFDCAIETGQSISVELAVPNLHTVTGINLDSLEYANGSSWHPSFRYPCQALDRSIERVPVHLH